MKSKTFTQNRMKQLLFIALLAIAGTTMSAQTAERTITGVVQSSFGPMDGATITVKGTVAGTYTDEEGKFSLTHAFKMNDVLLVSAMGMEDLEIPVKEDMTYIEPFLKDNPIVIVAALRKAPVVKKNKDKQPE